MGSHNHPCMIKRWKGSSRILAKRNHEEVDIYIFYVEERVYSDKAARMFGFIYSANKVLLNGMKSTE